MRNLTTFRLLMILTLITLGAWSVAQSLIHYDPYVAAQRATVEPPSRAGAGSGRLVEASGLNALFPDSLASPLPTLQGEAALTHLKQQGLYDSLRQAIMEAEDHDVAWQATTDTTFTQQQKLIPPDGGIPDVLFGSSVAISGDTAVIGDTLLYFRGAAYVFVRSGGLWTLQQKLQADEDADVPHGATFGFSVAINGDTVVVGASTAGDVQTPGGGNGAVYVFVRSGGVWTQQEKLFPPPLAGRFGQSVAISGETIVIGAPYTSILLPDGSIYNNGAAFVFVRSGGVWSQQQRLLAGDGSVGSVFGSSVAISGDTIVAGAPFAENSRGAAYIFVRNNGVWTQQQKFPATDQSRSWFGWSVGISGNTVVVGSPGNSTGDPGAADVYVRNGGVWTLQQTLLGDAGVAFQFGYWVGISGETAVIGVFQDTGGLAYVYSRSGNTWTKRQKLLPADGAGFFSFIGRPVAIENGTIIVSAADFYSQAVYVFAADNTAPAAICHNVTVSAGANCTANASIDNGSSDPDGDAITITQSPAGPYSLGSALVTLTVTDSKGASSQCMATVTVVDTTPPAIMACATNKTLSANDSGQAAIPNLTGEVSGADNCTAASALAITQSPVAGTLVGPGITTVTIFVKDAAGNTSTCAVTVMVTPASADAELLYLRGAGPNDNPPTLFLNQTAPTATTAKFNNSPAVNLSGGNPWKEVGVWTAAPSLTAGTLTVLSDLRVWLGLKNSDDQGTNFDLRVEVSKNGALVAAGETYCIHGVTRNPNLAKEVSVPFAPFSPVTFNGATDGLSLKVLTRIGSNGAGGSCGGHSNATGLRLYFDANTRPARFSATVAP